MRNYLTTPGSIVLIVTIAATTACTPKNEQPASSGAPGEVNASAGTEASTPSEIAAAPISVGESLEIAADKGALAGVIRFEGTAPKAKTVNFGPEKQCAGLHKTPPVYETLVTNPNGTLKWTLVSIKDRMPGDHPVPTEPAVIDQVGCVFTPHVVAVMEGQEIEFRNSDPVTHNVRASPKFGKAFNMIIPPKGPSQREELSVKELGIPIKCDIHFWMSGYVHVLRHPFFSVTGDDGTFIINNVPPGSYKLEAWHETLDSKTQEVTVEAGKVTQVDFVFSL